VLAFWWLIAWSAAREWRTEWFGETRCRA